MTREEAIKEIKDMVDSWQKDYAEEVVIATEGIQALNMEIKALKQEPCEDCISRADVRRILNHEVQILNVNTWKALYEKIDDLPSIQPKPKTGHWKKINVCYGCSECSLATDKSGVDFYRFCPNCGAKMESEGKE